MRNEKLLQLIGYYFSIDGNICELYDELIPLNSIIDKLSSNYIMNNIFFIVYDKNLTPSQMMENFINFQYNEKKYDDDRTQKENEINRHKEYISKLSSLKNNFHEEFAKFYRDKQKIGKIVFNDNKNENCESNIIMELRLKQSGKNEKYGKIKTRSKKPVIYYNGKENIKKIKKIVRKNKNLVKNGINMNKYNLIKNE